MGKSMPIRITQYIIAIIFFLFIAACASSVQNIGSNLYRVSCGGMLNDWGTCYTAAKEQCTNGYIERDRRQVNQPGQWNELCLCMIYPVDRDLVFSCR